MYWPSLAYELQRDIYCIIIVTLYRQCFCTLYCKSKTILYAAHVVSTDNLLHTIMETSLKPSVNQTTVYAVHSIYLLIENMFRIQKLLFMLQSDCTKYGSVAIEQGTVS